MRLPLLLLVSLPLAATLARAVDSAVPFRKITFAEATAAAAQENKIVFVDFFTTWCEPCKRLDADTFSDAAVGRLVGEAAVPLHLDAEKEGREVARRYKIEAYPTLLLVKPDGTEIDRLIGYREPAKFTAEFKAALAGKTAIVRAREKVDSAAGEFTREQVQARYDLARELARRGESAEALEGFLWCFDTGMKQVPSYAGVRTSFLTGELGRLAKKYPPATEALRTRRDDARARMLAGGDRMASNEFAALSEALGETGALLEAFDQLPPGDPRRRGFGLRVYRDLAQAQRYAEALEVQPYGTMTRLLESNANPSPTFPADARASLLKHGLEAAATNIEVLAGAGDLAHARELRDRVLALDGSAEMKDRLRAAVTRAGHAELAP